jgi:hypothetical protein
MQHLDEGLLHELVDGEIPSTDLPPIQAHLAACSECRARLEEAREFAGEAERLVEMIELPERDTPRAAVTAPSPRARPWGRDLAWAATVVVAVGAGYLARGGSRPDQPAENESAAPAPVAAPGTTPVSAPIIVAPAEPQRSTQAVSNQSDERRNQAAAPAPSRPPTPAKDFAKTALDAAAEGKVRLSESTVRDTAAKAREETVATAADKPAPGAALGRVRNVAPATPPTFRSGGRQEPGAGANVLRLDDQGRLTAGLKREAIPIEITFTEARRLLSDTLRLIEGLTPLRLEVTGTEVRVVYAFASGELALEQWLVDGRISYRLVAPTDFPPDSLKRLRERVRE